MVSAYKKTRKENTDGSRSKRQQNSGRLYKKYRLRRNIEIMIHKGYNYIYMNEYNDKVAGVLSEISFRQFF